MHEYKAIFFDLDETLLDFKASQRAALMRTHAVFMRDTHGAPSFDALLANFSQINGALWRRVEAGEIGPADVKHERFETLAQTLKLDASPSQCREMADFYEASLALSAVCLPKARETLERLKETHRLGIITNGLSAVQHSRIQLAGFKHLVESVFVSEEMGVAKPHKAVFDTALGHFGVLPSECLMVGDSLTSDYQGALNAGMDFCWINPEGRTIINGMPEPKWVLPNIACWPFVEAV